MSVVEWDETFHTVLRGLICRYQAEPEAPKFVNDPAAV